MEAANSVRHHIPEYETFYHKKFDEVKTHQHKRALALTSRKLIRLIFGLLANHQLYSANRVNQISQFTVFLFKKKVYLVYPFLRNLFLFYFFRGLTYYQIAF